MYKNKHKTFAEVAKVIKGHLLHQFCACLCFFCTKYNQFYFISCSYVVLSIWNIFYFLSRINTFYTVTSTKYFFFGWGKKLLPSFESHHINILFFTVWQIVSMSFQRTNSDRGRRKGGKHGDKKFWINSSSNPKPPFWSVDVTFVLFFDNMM